jgi:hypothetical protein
MVVLLAASAAAALLPMGFHTFQLPAKSTITFSVNESNIAVFLCESSAPPSLTLNLQSGATERLFTPVTSFFGLNAPNVSIQSSASDLLAFGVWILPARLCPANFSAIGFNKLIQTWLTFYSSQVHCIFPLINDQNISANISTNSNSPAAVYTNSSLPSGQPEYRTSADASLSVNESFFIQITNIVHQQTFALSMGVSDPVSFFDRCVFSEAPVYSLNGIQAATDPTIEEKCTSDPPLHENNFPIVVVSVIGGLMVLVVMFVIWYRWKKAAKWQREEVIQLALKNDEQMRTTPLLSQEDPSHQ